MIEVLQLLGSIAVGATTAIWLEKIRRVRKIDENELKQTINHIKRDEEGWVKVGGGYEYRHAGIRCRIEKISENSNGQHFSSNSFAYRLTVWKNDFCVFTGHHHGPLRPRYIYNDDFGRHQINILRKEVEKPEFYEWAKKHYEEWEMKHVYQPFSASGRKEAQRDWSYTRKVKMIKYLKQIQELPDEMPKGINRYQFKGFGQERIYLDILSEGNHWAYSVGYTGQSDDVIKKAVKEAIERKRAGENLALPWVKQEQDISKSKAVAAEWDEWKRTFDQKAAELKCNTQWLTHEEIHLVTETFPRDIEGLQELYKKLRDESKEDVKRDIENGLNGIHQTMELIQQHAEARKKAEIQKKLRVIQTR